MVAITVLGRTVSKSNSYRIAGRRLYKTKKVKDYEALVAATAAPHFPLPLPGMIYLKIDLYMHSKLSDIDNPLKSILDGLQSVAYNNDRQVVSLSVNKYYDKKNPRVDIFISSPPV